MQTVLLSLAVSAAPLAAARGTILVVMSSADTLTLEDGRRYATGVFLNELYLPVRDLKRLGFSITYATPDGRQATVDPESVKLKYWDSEASRDEALRYTREDAAYLKPQKLADALGKASRYAGLLVPGGQGLMADLIHDERLPRLLAEFHTAQKAIGLICHAPVLLTRFSSGKNPFRGYRVNSVARLEEWFIESFVMKGTPRIRRIAALLRAAGFEYESSFLPGRPYAVRDRNLVTSQNPFSGARFIALYRQALWDSGQIPSP